MLDYGMQTGPNICLIAILLVFACLQLYHLLFEINHIIIINQHDIYSSCFVCVFLIEWSSIQDSNICGYSYQVVIISNVTQSLSLSDGKWYREVESFSMYI